MGGTLPLQMSPVTSHHLLHSLWLAVAQAGVTQCSVLRNELPLGCHGSVFAGMLKASKAWGSVWETAGAGSFMGVGGLSFFVCSRLRNKLQLLLELDSPTQAFCLISRLACTCLKQNAHSHEIDICSCRELVFLHSCCRQSDFIFLCVYMSA